MRLIEINLHHSELAQDLLSQIIDEKKVELVIINNPYRNKNRGAWSKDITDNMGVWKSSRQEVVEVRKLDSSASRYQHTYIVDMHRQERRRYNLRKC